MSIAADQSATLFASAEDHLNSLLSWLQRLLAWQMDLTRLRFGTVADDAYRGLYISDAEIDLLRAEWAQMPQEMLAARAELSSERLRIERRAETTELAGVDLPLRRVARLYRLSAFEHDVLLLALAPELDLRYERIFAYIQDDVTRRRPAVDLALQVLLDTPGERRQRRRCFGTGAPLVRQRLIELFDDGQRQAALLSKCIKLDERLVTELLGQPMLDPLLQPFATLDKPRRLLDELVLPPAFVAQIRHILGGPPELLVLGLQGGYGSGRKALAQAMCAEADILLLTVAVDQLANSRLGPQEVARRIIREARLSDAAILLDGAERLLDHDGARDWCAALLGALAEHYGLAFLPLAREWDSRGMLRGGTYLRIELPQPSYSEREQLWRIFLGDHEPDESLQALASTFRLSGGQIRDAVAYARLLSNWRSGPLSADELYAACRAQSSSRLSSLAHKIQATYSWDDIVLPAAHVLQLREICLQVRHRRTVLETWGFDRRLAMGKGVNVLFAGPSGTGKTMAAEIIAADLGLDLYKIDLSTMVSKYIGETEKNLDQVFSAAREANAILFFDEADSIFGKRSEVKDAHDRYANIEVGYLLQKMEEYDGIVILSTNLRMNIDDAFVRRLHVAIDFPFPEEADRLRLWSKLFPAEAPLAPDIDLAFVARRFKLAGGNIRNIALLAAFLAAEDGSIITMSHLIHALRREYQKLGKLVTEADFGPYFAQTRHERQAVRAPESAESHVSDVQV